MVAVATQDGCFLVATGHGTTMIGGHKGNREDVRQGAPAGAPQGRGVAATAATRTTHHKGISGRFFRGDDDEVCGGGIRDGAADSSDDEWRAGSPFPW